MHPLKLNFVFAAACLSLANRHRVLDSTGGLDEVGSLRWELVAALAVAWLLIYVCVFKGVRSSGKVVYFTATFPYLMLAVLFVRGVTLPGAAKGLLFYIKPDFTRLKDTQVKFVSKLFPCDLLAAQVM